MKPSESIFFFLISLAYLTASRQFDSAESLKYSLTGLLTQSSAITACKRSVSSRPAAPKSIISWPLTVEDQVWSLCNSILFC